MHSIESWLKMATLSAQHPLRILQCNFFHLRAYQLAKTNSLLTPQDLKTLPECQNWKILWVVTSKQFFRQHLLALAGFISFSFFQFVKIEGFSGLFLQYAWHLFSWTSLHNLRHSFSVPGNSICGLCSRNSYSSCLSLAVDGHMIIASRISQKKILSENCWRKFALKFPCSAHSSKYL